MTPEGRVKKAVTTVLKNHAGVYFYMPVPSGYGRKSLDYIGCYRGRFFAIETKAPGKEPTDLQDITIASMKEAGAAVFVIDGVESRGMIGLLAFLAHGSNDQ